MAFLSVTGDFYDNKIIYKGPASASEVTFYTALTTVEWFVDEDDKKAMALDGQRERYDIVLIPSIFFNCRLSRSIIQFALSTTVSFRTVVRTQTRCVRN